MTANDYLILGMCAALALVIALVFATAIYNMKRLSPEELQREDAEQLEYLAGHSDLKEAQERLDTLRRLRGGK